MDNNYSLDNNAQLIQKDHHSKLLQNVLVELRSLFHPINFRKFHGIDGSPMRKNIPAYSSFINTRGSPNDIGHTLEASCAPIRAKGNSGLCLCDLATIPPNYFYSSSCAHMNKCCIVKTTTVCEKQWWLFPDTPGSKRFARINEND